MKGQDLQPILLDKNPLVVDPLNLGAVPAAAHVSAEHFLQQRWPRAAKRRLWHRAWLVAALAGKSGLLVPGAGGRGSYTPCPFINPARCLGCSRWAGNNVVPSAHKACPGQSCARGQVLAQPLTSPAGLGKVGVTIRQVSSFPRSGRSPPGACQNCSANTPHAWC